jgi:hypothetical protein
MARASAPAHSTLAAAYVDLSHDTLPNQAGIVRIFDLAHELMAHDSSVGQVTPGHLNIGITDPRKVYTYQRLPLLPLWDR